MGQADAQQAPTQYPLDFVQPPRQDDIRGKQYPVQPPAVMGHPADSGVPYPATAAAPFRGLPYPPRVPTTFALTLTKIGGRLQFPDCYSLDFHGRLSREDFSSIVAELNATATKYGPYTGPLVYATLLIPCVGICTMLAMKNKYEHMIFAIQDTCRAINERHLAAGKGHINLVYRDVLYDGCHRHRGNHELSCQVEVQVL